MNVGEKTIQGIILGLLVFLVGYSVLQGIRIERLEKKMTLLIENVRLDTEIRRAQEAKDGD